MLLSAGTHMVPLADCLHDMPDGKKIANFSGDKNDAAGLKILGESVDAAGAVMVRLCVQVDCDLDFAPDWSSPPSQ